MKSIKIVLLLCLFFSAVSSIHAQGLKVSVLNDLQEPLPHAYVYVNGRAVAVADDVGGAVIPQDKLKIGDTISISYVATEGQSVTVDQDMLTKGECQFILQEIYASLQADEVVVKADIAKLYRKHVNRREYYLFSSIWTADFLINVSKPGDSVRTVDGKLKIAMAGPYSVLNVIVSDPNLSSAHSFPFTAYDSVQHPRFWSHLPLEITTSDDTTGLLLTFKDVLAPALALTNQALVYAKSLENIYAIIHHGAKLSYGYLGKDQYHRIFRLNYSGGELGENRQILIKCDTKSGDIREITTNSLDLHYGTNISIKAKIRNAKKSLTVMYIPIELEYRIKYNNGRIEDVMMKNIDFKYYPWKDADIKRALKTGKLD